MAHMLFGRDERCPCELWCFFAAQFSCEIYISGWDVMLLWGVGALLRALRVRVGACLAVVQCLDEMTRFLAAECSCWWCDVRTVERCVTWTHASCDARRFTRGWFVWVGGVNVGHLKNVWPSLGCHRIVWSEGSSFGLSCSCALTVHVIGLLVFATVFYYASAFNGDLNQWDVVEVTIMLDSKSICIAENDLTWP